SEEFTLRASFKTENFTVVDRDPESDLALLRLESGNLDSIAFAVGPEQLEARPQPTRFRGEGATDGEPVAVSGYPLGEAALVTNAGAIASSWTLSTNKADRYLGDFTANPGNSGGPVYHVPDAS